MTNRESIIIENVGQSIVPGLGVYDSEGKKVGTVRDVRRASGYFQVQIHWFSEDDLYVPFRLITNIDPRELFVSVSRDELNKKYSNPPPRTTRVEEEFGDQIAITTEPSGYDGEPFVVQRVRVADLKRSIVLGAHVFTSDLHELGVVKQYDETKGTMWIADDIASSDPTLTLPVEIVDSVNPDTHTISLVASQADLERLEHLVPRPATGIHRKVGNRMERPPHGGGSTSR